MIEEFNNIIVINSDRRSTTVVGGVAGLDSRGQIGGGASSKGVRYVR